MSLWRDQIIYSVLKDLIFFFFYQKLTLLSKHRSNPVHANQIFVPWIYFPKYFSASKLLIANEVLILVFPLLYVLLTT